MKDLKGLRQEDIEALNTIFGVYAGMAAIWQILQGIKNVAIARMLFILVLTPEQLEEMEKMINPQCEALRMEIEKMKKIGKIILIVLGSIVVSIIIGILLIFLVGRLLPEPDMDPTEQEPTISIDSNQPIEDIETIGGVPDIPEEDLQYYGSIEDALKKTTGIFQGYTFFRKIDQEVKHFEGVQYAILFYTAIKDKKIAGFNAATFKTKKIKNKKKQYALMTIEPTEWKKMDGFILVQMAFGDISNNGWY